MKLFTILMILFLSAIAAAREPFTRNAVTRAHADDIGGSLGEPISKFLDDEKTGAVSKLEKNLAVITYLYEEGDACIFVIWFDENRLVTDIMASSEVCFQRKKRIRGSKLKA